MSNINDEELKSLLKRNQPKPPAPDSNELDRLLIRLNIRSRKFDSYHFAIGSLVAACFLMGLFVTQKPIESLKIKYSQLVQGEKSTIEGSSKLEDEDTDLFSEDRATLEVGEAYIELTQI